MRQFAVAVGSGLSDSCGTVFGPSYAGRVKWSEYDDRLTKILPEPERPRPRIARAGVAAARGAGTGHIKGAAEESSPHARYAPQAAAVRAAGQGDDLAVPARRAVAHGFDRPETGTEQV